ncbi:hypothetical protein GQ53DRAFT_748427 [Thozetella sp. PMI_491]|nr:hypothetical protein GQ53DRAFT_748427 [Thozetella sp. PMI_491]
MPDGMDGRRMGGILGAVIPSHWPRVGQIGVCGGRWSTCSFSAARVGLLPRLAGAETATTTLRMGDASSVRSRPEPKLPLSRRAHISSAPPLPFYSLLSSSLS